MSLYEYFDMISSNATCKTHFWAAILRQNIGFLSTLLTYNLACMVMQLFMPQRIYGLRIDKRHDMRQFLGMIWENGNSAHIYVHTLIFF